MALFAEYVHRVKVKYIKKSSSYVEKTRENNRYISSCFIYSKLESIKTYKIT